MTLDARISRRATTIALGVAVSVVILVAIVAARSGHHGTQTVAIGSSTTSTSSRSATTVTTVHAQPQASSTESLPATSTASTPEPTTTLPAIVTAEGTGASGGLTVTIVASQGGGPGVVDLAVRAQDTDGRWSGYGPTVLDYGDGSTPLPPRPNDACDTVPAQSRASGSPPEPLDQTDTFHHSYRATGTYRINVQVTTRVDCTDQGKDTATATATIDVPAVSNASNGPLTPAAQVISLGGSQGSLAVSLGVDATDEDGWITGISIDWGDGSPVEAVSLSDSAPCADSPTVYPASRRGGGPNHEYTNAGTYTVTLTATSTGCDGNDQQQGTGERNQDTFTVGQ